MDWIIMWLVGAIATYFVVKYYEWDMYFDGYHNPPVFIFCIFWFIGLPFLLIMKLGEKMAQLGRRDRQRKQEKLYSKRR